MPIKQKGSISDIRRFYIRRIGAWHDAIIEKLAVVGEKCLSMARTGHLYMDRTGNLTSSIGYCIVDNGEIILQSSFNRVNGADKSRPHTGSNDGKTFLASLAKKYSSGIVFIMVAGMPYAKYVEERGYGAFKAAENLAEFEVRKILKALKISVK